MSWEEDSNPFLTEKEAEKTTEKIIDLLNILSIYECTDDEIIDEAINEAIRMLTGETDSFTVQCGSTRIVFIKKGSGFIYSEEPVF